jgi:hypothetical protein
MMQYSRALEGKCPQFVGVAATEEMEGGKMIGIVSIRDIVNWIISTQSATLEQMEQYISGGYWHHST